MKKYILILAFILLLPSCDDEIDETMKNIVMDLIENPDKLRDIPKYYPQYYNSEYFQENCKDTNRVNKLIDFLKNDFKNRKGSLKIYKSLEMNRYFKDRGYKYNFKDEEIFACGFCKNNICFEVTFFKKDSIIYIFYFENNFMSLENDYLSE